MIKERMLASPDVIPICAHCDMRQCTNATDQEMSIARAAAVDIAYNELAEPSEVSDRLEERGFSAELSVFAIGCLGQIQRRYCREADRGLRDDGSFGVIRRTDI